MKKRTIISAVAVNIPLIIKSRLNLQTTQRYLINQFDIKVPIFETLISSSFLSRLRTWDDSTKKAFYMVTGGASNIKSTKEFFEDLLKKQISEINVFQGEKIKEIVRN